MVDYATIQQKIDRGLGIASNKLGQPFDVYRANGVAAATGDFPSGWEKVASNFPMFRKLVASTKLETGVRSDGIMWYDLIGSCAALLLGDVFYQVDAPFQDGVSYGAGATVVPGSLQFQGMALSWHMPVHKPVGARVNFRAKIARPSLQPQQLTDGTLYWSETFDNDVQLQLTGGQFAFGQPGDPGNWVPVGLFSIARPYTRQQIQPNTPNVAPVSWFYAYVPPLNGYKPTEGDAIITEDGARYMVTSPYEQDVGTSGSSLLLQRLTSQVQ